MQHDPLGLEALLAPIVQGMGFELWGIEFRNNPQQAFLRVYIDHENGVNLDDCSAVSHQISGVLDVEDPIKVAYTLEVSSPGIDRPLFKTEQFVKAVGQVIKLRLSWPVENRRNMKGTLQEVSQESGEEALAIQVDNETFNVPLNAIKRAHIIYEGKAA